MNGSFFEKKTIVFTGLTLSDKEVSTFLPNAWVHSPVKCGDIFRVLRLKPSKIIIVDGLFEQSPSVWHKEILIAINIGVSVYGSSSMGALRAAELHSYGMIGFGKIFEYYKNNKWADDDDVAVTYSKNPSTFVQSIPLINIRFTLEKARNKKIINNHSLIQVISNIKKFPYYERNWKNIEKAISDKMIYNWVVENYVDQKRLDAIELLKYIRWNNQTNKIKNNKIVHTSYFIKKLYREVMNTQFDVTYNWLPDE